MTGPDYETGRTGRPGEPAQLGKQVNYIQTRLRGDYMTVKSLIPRKIESWSAAWQ